MKIMSNQELGQGLLSHFNQDLYVLCLLGLDTMRAFPCPLVLWFQSEEHNTM